VPIPTTLIRWPFAAISSDLENALEVTAATCLTTLPMKGLLFARTSCEAIAPGLTAGMHMSRSILQPLSARPLST
jgi:hypothetical protein